MASRQTAACRPFVGSKDKSHGFCRFPKMAW